MQYYRISEIRLYEFKSGHIDVEIFENIYCAKGEVNGWFKKSCLGYKKLADQARSWKPKTLVSAAMEANLSRSTQKVSDKFNNLLFGTRRYLHDHCKLIRICSIVSKNIAKHLIRPSNYFLLTSFFHSNLCLCFMLIFSAIFMDYFYIMAKLSVPKKKTIEK